MENSNLKCLALCLSFRVSNFEIFALILLVEHTKFQIRNTTTVLAQVKCYILENDSNIYAV